MDCHLWLSQIISVYDSRKLCSNNVHILPRLLLLPDAAVRTKHAIITRQHLSEKTWCADQRPLVISGSVFAFCGGAAIGHAANSFKSFDAAVPLQVISVLPMELTIRDSHILIPSMCVRALGHWLVGEFHRGEHCVWLGWSLGVVVALEAVLLCEMALVQQRAIVALDSRGSPPW